MCGMCGLAAVCGVCLRGDVELPRSEEPEVRIFRGCVVCTQRMSANLTANTTAAAAAQHTAQITSQQSEGGGRARQAGVLTGSAVHSVPCLASQ